VRATVSEVSAYEKKLGRGTNLVRGSVRVKVSLCCHSGFGLAERSGTIRRSRGLPRLSFLDKEGVNSKGELRAAW
jgi:hypothetical protein